ncbi:HemK/PrmC family methyltransferase [Thermosipho atlanticus]|uniref:Release factor glutamine methyltransferase n=1 Tax=Thermosipho atlanticus DSM 15807 TaxID=1123380 RepID=A0A1M5R0M6_9BACT|nr:HemK/PrmC family methyltransferase [Thermosipho atlanticus]SHH19912.1 release factor glutamine methyltransferase [Thermosipho atlanticus DSM 15807]
MKIKEALKIAKENGLPELEAHLIICSIINKNKEFIIAHPEYELYEESFIKLIEMRKEGYPLQYITKGKEFFKRWFYIEEGVFIPRYETEFLVEVAITYIKKYNIKKFCEIGVGSGAIIISILSETATFGYGTDISRKAIKVTSINAERLGVKDRLVLKKGSFLEPFKKIYNDLELIVSNPPYVKIYSNLQKELFWEPREALFAGEDGLDFYKEFLNMYNLSGKIVILEIGHDQGDFFRKMGWKVLKDYSGNDRVAVYNSRR